jgi:hypothetical protein
VAKRLRLHDTQGLPPVAAAGEPDEGDTGRMRGTLWLHMTCLIQGELLTEQAVFGGSSSRGAAKNSVHGQHMSTILCRPPTRLLLAILEYCSYEQCNYHAWLLLRRSTSTRLCVQPATVRGC